MMRKPAQSSIPRGIQVIEWRNQNDRSKQLRFRVRIKRKAFKCDKLFETLDEAKEFLALSISEKTRASLYTPEMRAEIDAISGELQNPSFSFYAAQYIKLKITPRLETRGDRANQIKDYTTRANAIGRIEVEASEGGMAKRSMFSGMMLEGWTFPKKPLGDLPLSEINGRVVASYIKARLLEVKPTTVSRELQFISAVFNWIRGYDPKAWEKCGGKNPVSAADKSELEIANEMKQAEDSFLPDRRITPQQERALFDALAKNENNELFLISALCHATGMRRSEAMLLRWRQLRDDYIQLGITKRGKPRRVPITSEVRKILETVKKKDERLFHYSVYGFNSAWRRLLDRTAVLDDDGKELLIETDEGNRPLTLRDTQLRFHNMRHEYISRLVELQLANKLPSIAVQQLAGIQDDRHFQIKYVEPAQEHAHIKRTARGQTANDESDLMRDVGHATRKMTNHYASLGQAAMISAANAASPTKRVSSQGTVDVEKRNKQLEAEVKKLNKKIQALAKQKS